VEKYDKARQVTCDNIIWRMRFVCRMTEARIQKHTQNIYLNINQLVALNFIMSLFHEINSL